jgi:large subunit ribosomal protein L21
MFAILKTGGKQYCVKPGDVLKVELLENEPSSVVSLTNVLLTSDGNNVTFGSPVVEGASVLAEVIRHVRDRKVIVFKKRRRHNSRRKNGHRQWRTILRVTDISLSGLKGE